MERFPLEKYASLELNQVAFPKTGLVVSQTPLGSAFDKDDPCENGMWVLADKSKGYINPVVAVTDTPLGIVYTAEKEYDNSDYGLKNFGRKVEGDYPRVGILSVGDTVTTNCVQYDTDEFATFAALETALKAAAQTPVYVIAVAGDAVPKLTASISGYNGPYAKVTKYYTVPNGEKGIKYQMIRL
jgi:hypothetical protein